MSDPDPHDDEPDGVIALGRSVIDRINARHADGRKPLFLPIPRWEGDVLVECQGLKPKALRQAMKARRQGNTAVLGDLLVAACKEVYVLDDAGERVPARETSVGGDGNPNPVRYDGRLADLFKLPSNSETPRLIALAMYLDETAVAAHVKKVVDWQTGEDLDDGDDEEVDAAAGEEAAAT